MNNERDEILCGTIDIHGIYSSEYSFILSFFLSVSLHRCLHRLSLPHSFSSPLVYCYVCRISSIHVILLKKMTCGGMGSICSSKCRSINTKPFPYITSTWLFVIFRLCLFGSFHYFLFYLHQQHFFLFHIDPGIFFIIFKLSFHVSDCHFQYYHQ